MILTHSPTKIFRALLIEKGHGHMPSLAGNDKWPIHTGIMAEETRDRAIGLSDTAGIRNGRLMQGEVIEKPGLQVIVRALRYDEAYTKILAIKSMCDEIKMEPILVEGTAYLIQAIHRPADVGYIGSDLETKRRDNFSLNVVLSVKQTS